MSDYSSLKATINANVKANNNHEITGSIMNSVLNAMVDSLGAGYQFMGVATPTNPGSAQTPDYKCFYLATTPGAYTYLGGLVVSDGEVALLKWDSAWTKEVTGIASADQLNRLTQEIGVNLLGSVVMTDTSLQIRSSGKFITGSGYVNPDPSAVIILLPCTKGDIVYLVANNSGDCKYAYLPSDSVNTYDTISFCSGTGLNALSGEIILNDIPSDCKCLYILVGRGDSVYLQKIVSNCEFVYKHEEEINELQDDTDKIHREFGFYYSGANAALSSCPYRKTGLFIRGNGEATSNPDAIYLMIPFESGEKIVVNGKSDACKYAYLTSDVLVAGSIAPFCSGYSSTIGADGLTEVVAVADCKFLYVLVTNTAGSNFVNYVKGGVNGDIEELKLQLPALYYKSFTTDTNINKFFKELYLAEDTDYSLVKKVRVTNCILDGTQYYVGVTFRNAQNQYLYGTNYAFSTLEEAQAFKKEIFATSNVFAVADYDAIVDEGGATDWMDVTLLEAVNNIHLSPAIEEYIHNNKLSSNVYETSDGKYLRFAMFSDPHYSGNDSQEAIYRNNLLIDSINKLQKEKPLQFIISGGDTGVAGVTNGVLADPLPDFRETFLTKFPAQFFSALGNHDGFTVEQWKDAFYHDTQFSFETDGYYFIFLDVYMDGVYDGSERVLSHVLRCYVGTDPTSELRVLLAQYDVDVDSNGYCVLQDVLDIPELAAQFTAQVDYEYQGIDFEFLETELEKAKRLKKKPFVVAHTTMDDSEANKLRFAHLLHDYDAIYLKGHEHYSYHQWDNPDSSLSRHYTSCPGWFALDWGGYGGNQTPWAIDVIEIGDDGNLKVVHYIPAQTHTRGGQTYNIEESTTEYIIEQSGKSLVRASFDLRDFNNNAKG